MKQRIILSLIVAFTLLLPMQAQERKGRPTDFDVEKHHQEQADFFAKELNFTDAEKKSFTPLVQEYFHARFELNKNMRNAEAELDKKNDATSADYQKLIDMYLDAKTKDLELQKDFIKKIGKVLPAEKVYKYNRAEKKFIQRAVRKHHREDRDR